MKIRGGSLELQVYTRPTYNTRPAMKREEQKRIGLLWPGGLSFLTRTRVNDSIRRDCVHGPLILRPEDMRAMKSDEIQATIPASNADRNSWDWEITTINTTLISYSYHKRWASGATSRS